jgi:hypothetical protein
MDPTALYYALSTIAQCAAALAAILGSFGLWRLGHFWELDHEAEGQERRLRHDLAEARAQREYEQENEAPRAAETEVEQSPPSTAVLLERGLELRLTSMDVHRHFIMDERKQLTKKLYVFLLVTLAILVLAIVGIPFVDSLKTWPWTVTTLIILASLGLGVGPFYVVREAARTRRL